jgi:hypothetical protein
VARVRLAPDPPSRAGGEPVTGERTPAQLYALLFGIVLLVVGVLGFIADSSFGTGSDVDGSDLIVFE